jgi:hypothetical protein
MFLRTIEEKSPMNRWVVGATGQSSLGVGAHNQQPVIGVWQVAILAFLFVSVFFVWESHQGFNLADDSYLWYGVQRVLAGEIPIRDFQAYDPGRYYLGALFMGLSGAKGIMALRYVLVVVQLLAMAAALASIASVRPLRGGITFLSICALTFAIWMVPRYKMFDMAVAITQVCMFACLIRRTSPSNFFLSGLVLGFATYIGRNHGLYGAAAILGILVYLAIRCEDWRAWRHGILWLVAGCLVGYLPMFATMLLATGFTEAFVDSIRFVFEVKSTNLPLPVPWPWGLRFWQYQNIDNGRELALGLFFVAMLVFGTLAIVAVLVRRWQGKPVQPLLVACAFCALPYAHYSFSRADPEHLALGIFPTLIGLFTLAGTARTWVRALIALPLCAGSIFTMLPSHPGWRCMGARNCPSVEIGHDRIRMDRGTASDVALFRRLQHDFAPNGQSVFVTPMHPGAAALLGTKSPTWEIYTAWPRPDTFQREEIARLEAAKPGFILVYDFPLDDRDELRYKNTHPLIDRYIKNNYVPVEGYTDNPAYQIYRPR